MTIVRTNTLILFRKNFVVCCKNLKGDKKLNVWKNVEFLNIRADAEQLVGFKTSMRMNLLNDSHVVRKADSFPLCTFFVREYDKD